MITRILVEGVLKVRNAWSKETNGKIVLVGQLLVFSCRWIALCSSDLLDCFIANISDIMLFYRSVMISLLLTHAEIIPFLSSQ